MRFICDYMKDDALRHELNELTREVFGFDFEDWETEGYDEGDYIPYSFEENGKLIANVSANRMEFRQNGRPKNYIQLGTVMTAEPLRNRGYAAKLMRRVIAEYEENCDGIYLFANLEALGFYEKLGFRRGMEYRYALREDLRRGFQERAQEFGRAQRFAPLADDDVCAEDRYIDMARSCAFMSALELVNQFGLLMFYTARMEQIYWCEDLSCFAAMEREGDTLYLRSVICHKKIRLEDVLARVRGPYERLILGFAPCAEDRCLFDAAPYDGGEDYRLLIRGARLDSIEAEKLCFPDYSHA